MLSITKFKDTVFSVFSEEMIKIFLTTILGGILLWLGKFVPSINNIIYSNVTISYASLALIILLSMMVGSLIIFNIMKYQVERYKRLASTDKLTGLYNYHELSKLLDYEVSRSEMYNIPLSIVLINIDNFTDINNEHGFDKGNIVIKQFAKVLQKGIVDPVTGKKKYFGIRKSDFAFRYKSGDGFLILLPGTNAIDAEIVAKRLDSEVKEYNFYTEGHNANSKIALTISQAVVGYEKNIDSSNSMLLKADHRLSYAKQTGKNKVISTCNKKTNSSGHQNIAGLEHAT